jgi:hypothetical protein
MGRHGGHPFLEMNGGPNGFVAATFHVILPGWIWLVLGAASPLDKLSLAKKAALVFEGKPF